MGGFEISRSRYEERMYMKIFFEHAKKGNKKA